MVVCIAAIPAKTPNKAPAAPLDAAIYPTNLAKPSTIGVKTNAISPNVDFIFSIDASNVCEADIANID